MSNKSLKFNTRKLSNCYRQSAIGGENITSFNITIVPSKHVRIGNHGSTRIIMSEYGNLVTICNYIILALLHVCMQILKIYIHSRNLLIS